MSLIESFKTPCTLFEKHRTTDEEGGFVTEWVEGLRFMAAITFDSTISARVAEKEGMKSVYTVTTAKDQPLEFHDVFQRDNDGKIFRITSDGRDKQTPDVSSFQFSQSTAEEWELS
jgi:hypothetical protein